MQISGHAAHELDMRPNMRHRLKPVASYILCQQRLPAGTQGPGETLRKKVEALICCRRMEALICCRHILLRVVHKTSQGLAMHAAMARDTASLHQISNRKQHISGRLGIHHDIQSQDKENRISLKQVNLSDLAVR